MRSRENNGDDSYGFSLLSVYTNDYSDEHFNYDGETYLATSAENGKDRFYNIYFDNKKNGAYQRTQFKTSFASVRCIKNWRTMQNEAKEEITKELRNQGKLSLAGMP